MWRMVVLHVNKVSDQSVMYIIDVAIMEMQVKVYENWYWKEVKTKLKKRVLCLEAESNFNLN